MSRYIDADLLYKETEKKIKANNEYGRAVVDDEFLDLINDAPTEDVEEVRRGEWIMTDSRFAEMSCSVCGFKYYGEYDKECMSNYCPECGAKMDGERR